MTPEDRLRSAITARTSSVEPSADALHRIEERLMDAQRDTNRTRWLIGLGSAAAAVLVVVGVFALTGDDDDGGIDTVGTTTTTTDGTTSTSDGTTTTVPDIPGAVDAAAAVFPDPSTSRRFDAPEALALSFATDVVGMTSPIVGEFQQGDSRSGEVEVRGFSEGAPTVVFVRQLEDDHWFVIGAATESIQPALPEPGATITSPQALTGRAYAFEGTVQVFLLVDGVDEPIGQTFVTGRGDGTLGDYAGELTFTAPEGAEYATVIYTSEGGEDGAPIAAAATRVRLG